jgi:hypothetical protein
MSSLAAARMPVRRAFRAFITGLPGRDASSDVRSSVRYEGSEWETEITRVVFRFAFSISLVVETRCVVQTARSNFSERR